MATVDAPAQLTPIGSFTTWFRNAINRVPSPEEHEAVDELIPQGGPEFVEYVVRFSLLIAMSASIAAFGLLADSAAVVIGAMLVAPLMTPITAAAAATVTARNARLWRALAVVAWGTVLAIAVGWLVALIAGGSVVDLNQLPREVQAQPSRPSSISASRLPPAPPPATSSRAVQPPAPPGRRYRGRTRPAAGDRRYHRAAWPRYRRVRNAFLLFLTNLAAIIFSAGIALALTGFRPNQFGGKRALRTRMAITLVTVAVVRAIPLTFHTRTTIEDLRLRRAVTDAVAAWDSEVRIVEVTADAYGNRASVEAADRRTRRPPTGMAARRRDSGPLRRCG